MFSSEGVHRPSSIWLRITIFIRVTFRSRGIMPTNFMLL